jgi:hypothetical protein
LARSIGGVMEFMFEIVVPIALVIAMVLSAFMVIGLLLIVFGYGQS